VTVRLIGQHTVTNTFDGYPNGHFGTHLLGSFINTDSFIAWQIFTDTDNNLIDPGQIIHVGWSTTNPATSRDIRDMYWTDAQHNRIGGSIIFNSTPKFSYQLATQVVHVTWGNQLVPQDPGTGQPQTMHIDQIVWALVDQPVPLALLNRQNTALQFQP